MTNNFANIELGFKIGHCNGTMCMQILVDDLPAAEYRNIESDYLVFKHCVKWPSTLKIILSDKNLACDTKVDESGKITADKFIKLEKLVIDRMEAGVEYLNSLMLDTGENKVTSNYWGFNGVVEIKLNYSDSFLWHLAQRIDKSTPYVVHRV